MNKLAITLLLAFFFSFAQGQVVLLDSCFSITIDNDLYAIDSARRSSPSYGTNQVWDYTGLMQQNSIVVVHDSISDPMFPSADRYEVVLSGIDTFRSPTFYYQEKDAASFRNIGIRVNARTFSLFNFTGAAGDSIWIETNHQNINTRILKFPATTGDNWQDPFRIVLAFRVTAAGFGIQNIPYRLVSNCVDNSIVRGTGKLKYLDGMGNSQEEDAILIQRTVTYFDSLYQGIGPASGVVLTALGITQGQRRQDITHSFWLTKSQREQMIMRTDTANTAVIFDTKHFRNVVTAVDLRNKFGTFSIYPNPANELISLDTKNLNTNIDAVKIYDINGKELINESNLLSNSINSIDVAQLSVGNYLCVAYSKGQIVASEKFIIAR